MERPTVAGRVEAVVIGTSAGGVDALSVLLPAVPARSRAPVFVVVHLPRERPSLLVDIFQAKCQAPVREPVDKEPVERGTIYFAPPDYHLLLEAGPAIALSSDELVHHSRPSIDVLFESAADVYGSGVMGMVLTGANADGADGLAAVRARGGLAVVQDPRDAYAPPMIEAALARGPVDYVGTLEEIGALLRSLDHR